MGTVSRTAFEQDSLVTACRASGLSAKAFAEREHIPPSTLYQWLAKRSHQKPALRIARVLRQSPSPAGTVASRPSAAALVVELGAARVRVDSGFDRDLFVQVLDVLEPRCRKEPS